MSVVITDAKAIETLPKYIRGEMDRLYYMNNAYGASGSTSGFTKLDLARQAGEVWGLKHALLHVMQEEACAAAAPEPAPALSITDLEQRFGWLS